MYRNMCRNKYKNKYKNTHKNTWEISMKISMETESLQIVIELYSLLQKEVKDSPKEKNIV